MPRPMVVPMSNCAGAQLQDPHLLQSMDSATGEMLLQWHSMQLPCRLHACSLGNEGDNSSLYVRADAPACMYLYMRAHATHVHAHTQRY